MCLWVCGIGSGDDVKLQDIYNESSCGVIIADDLEREKFKIFKIFKVYHI